MSDAKYRTLCMYIGPLEVLEVMMKQLFYLKGELPPPVIEIIHYNWGIK